MNAAGPRRSSPDRARAGKKRVAIDLSILDRTQGGTAVYARELVREFGELSPGDIEILHLRGPRFVARKNRFTKALNLLIELCWVHALLPLRLALMRADLLHMPADVAPLFSPCPVVVTIHDANFRRFPETYDPGYRRYARLAFSLSARRSARVITDSGYSARDMEKYFSARPEKVSVVHLGVSGAPDTPASQEARDESPYILFVGKIEPHKNVRRLVEACARLRESNEGIARDHRLVVAGGFGRDHEQVVAEIARRRLGNVVETTGRVDQTRLEQLYRHASVFAFPSLNEGFGFPPLEAMARGVPVVAAAAGSLPEVLGDAALYCDPLDPGDIASALSRVLLDEPLRQRLVGSGYERVKQFTWERTARATLEIYRGVLGV